MSTEKKTKVRLNGRGKAAVALLIIAIIAIFVGCKIKFGKVEEKPTENPETSTTKQAETTTQKPVEKVGAGYEYAYAGFNPAFADMTAEWNLLLVNRDYILPDDYIPELETLSEINSSEQLDKRVVPHYIEMFNAAATDGLYLTPLSGYRTVELQKSNYENLIDSWISQGLSKAEAAQKAAEEILPPSTSEHNAGLAMDIISLEESFEDTEEYKWLSEHAADYGFILRYPKDKTDVTKIMYEPWHWRYVGVEAAQKIKASGMVLEEYLNSAD